MAVNSTKKAKNDLHAVVMEMLSTYDLSNKLVQAFISKMSRDITTKYGPLKEIQNKQTDTVGNVTDTVNTNRVQQRATRKNVTPITPRSAVETLDAKQNTSIYQDLAQAKNDGLIGVIKSLVKKREKDDGTTGSYLGDLKETFKGKSLFDGARSAVSEIFKEKPFNKKDSLKTNKPQTNTLASVTSNNVTPGEQQLNLIKDEIPVQRVVIDDISQNVLDSIEKTLTKSFSGLTSFKKDLIDSLKKNSSDTTENLSDGGGLFGFIKNRFKNRRANKNLTKQVTKTASKEVASKQIVKTAGKEAAKTVGKEVVTTTGKQAAKTVGKEVVTATGKEVGRAVSKEAAKTASKETTGVVGKEAAKIASKETTEVTGKEAAKVVGKQAAKSVSKEVTEVTGKQVISAATKTGGKEVAEVASKQVGKEAAKVGGKSLGKSLLKKIPGVGLIAGLGFGAERALSGDWAGAGLELASGAASTLPGVGTAASLGIDAALAGRDVYKTVNEPGYAPESSATTPEVPVTQTPITPIETPQRWTPIQEQPALPRAPLLTETSTSASILEKIAKNTETTNSQFAGLIQAIYKLAGAISNNQSTPVPPNIVMNQPQNNNPLSMSQIAAANIDPIRGVRANFANT